MSHKFFSRLSEEKFMQKREERKKRILSFALTGKGSSRETSLSIRFVSIFVLATPMITFEHTLEQHMITF